MRFVPITKGVSIQYWLEFVGEAADKIRGIEADIEAELWPYVADIHYEPERVIGGKPLQVTTRLYLDGVMEFDYIIVFERAQIDALLGAFGVQENFCKFQLRRENGARIVCFRPSDEHPALTGFGRTKPGATHPCHQDFSETYVDRKPGMGFTNYKGENQVWGGFKPLYVKVQPAINEEYEFRIDVNWASYEEGKRIEISFQRDVDFPSELVAYQFSPRSNNTAVDPELGEKNAEALEDLFARTRKPWLGPGSNKMNKVPHPQR